MKIKSTSFRKIPALIFNFTNCMAYNLIVIMKRKLLEAQK